MSIGARVCIIGSGVAGGVVATGLADAGVTDVLMVESGSAVPMRDRRIWHDYFMGSGTLTHGANVYQASDYVNTGSQPYRLIRKAMRARGGTTIWGGEAFRLKPEDFQLKTRTGHGFDWPISYDDLEPFYALAERTLQVSGDATDAGHPPRSGPFPLPAFDFQEYERPFLKALNDSGYSSQHVCLSRNTAPINGMPQCMLTGTCEYCPIGGRFTADQLIDRLESRPGFRLLTNTPAIALRFSSTKLIASLEILDLSSGERHEVVADWFVVCAGGIESPKLLLASAAKAWPNGVGNEHGHVGRTLTNHIELFIEATSRAPKRSGAIMDLDFSTLTTRHLDDPANQATGKGYVCFEQAAPDLGELITRGASLKALRREFDAPLTGKFIHQMEQFPAQENFVGLAPGEDSRGLRRTRIEYSIENAKPGIARARSLLTSLFDRMDMSVIGEKIAQAAHPMGTCRMSSSPDQGVVDRDLRVHGIDNLYVCSSAVFPTGGAAGPTLTLAALAHRAVAHLKAQLKVPPAAAAAADADANANANH